MQPDPIVEEVRKIRDEHAARFNYDLRAIYLDIKEREQKSGRTYVTYPSRKPVLRVEEVEAASKK